MPIDETLPESSILPNQVEVATNNRITMLKGEGREILTRAAIADGSIILGRRHFFEQSRSSRGHPTDAKPGEPIGLGHDSERDRVLVEGSGRRKSPGGVDLESPINLVGKKI